MWHLVEVAGGRSEGKSFITKKWNFKAFYLFFRNFLLFPHAPTFLFSFLLYLKHFVFNHDFPQVVVWIRLRSPSPLYIIVASRSKYLNFFPRDRISQPKYFLPLNYFIMFFFNLLILCHIQIDCKNISNALQRSNDMLPLMRVQLRWN